MTRVGAFLFLTRCLAGEVREIPGSVDWPRVVEIAGEQWMTLALYHELKDQAPMQALPPDLVEYFECLHEANESRNRAILAHISEIAVLLNGMGVEPLLLKGAGHLASGLYSDPAVRLLYDIDVFVPGERALELWRHLVAAGYRSARPEHRPEDSPEIEWPALVRPGRMAEVELHRSVEWNHMLGSPELYSWTQPVALRRGRARILDPTGRMIFTLAHAFVHHRAPFKAAAHWRDMYDAALLVRRYGEEIHWPRVAEAFQAAGESKALRQACEMWRRLFGEEMPCAAGRSFSLYWPRCLVNVAKPQLVAICGLLHDNFHQELTPALLRPSVLSRKIRFVARIYGRAPASFI